MSNTTQAQIGNPLLYSLPIGRRTLEPYWVIIAQIVLIQFCQRLWNRVRYKTWLLQLELIVMFDWKYSSDKATAKYKFKLDFFDAFQTTWVAGHFVWYCVLQGSCMSAANASTWGCFNIFGYVLMNYVTPSAVSLSMNIFVKVSKCIQIFGGGTEYSEVEKTITGLLCIWCYTPTIAFVLVIVTYFDVNIFPMLCCYEWIALIWIICVSLASVIVGLVLLTCPINRKEINQFRFKRFMLAIFISTQTTMVAYLAVLLYNYSQYWYFGDTYIHAIVSEFESRDTNRYFQALANSSEQIAHTILSSLG